MGYLFALTAVFAGAVKGYCGKKTSGAVAESKDAMFINFVRMLFCVVIGFALIAVQGNLPSLKIDGAALLICLLSGVTTSLFVVTWLISVKNGAYMMLDVFLMLGVVVTLVLGVIFFRESVKWNQVLGLGVLLVAVYIMCSYNKGLNGKMTLLSVVLLFVCGAVNGICDFSQKLYVKTVADYDVAVFQFYTYVFSAVTLLVFYGIFSLKNKVQSKKPISLLKQIFWYVLIMSACLFINSFFKTQAATLLDSAQLYPLNQGLSLMLSSVMSAVFFKEKLNIKCIIGLLLAFCALLIINLL